MKLRFLIELSHVLNQVIVPREEWQARPPKEKLPPIHTPVPYVVIHHTYVTAACYNKDECTAAMRRIQNMHMDERGWLDIGYHFAIGSDGSAYEGCGWRSMGQHAKFFNSVSLGLTLIGDWRNEAPPLQQINTLKALITAGVELQYIRPDYKIVSHHQVGNTDCPGLVVQKLIQTWDHYSSFPGSYKDLINVREIPDYEKQLIANATPTDSTVMFNIDT